MTVVTIVISPHLEYPARESVILTHHYSQPVCTPTRAALLTGREILCRENYYFSSESLAVVSNCNPYRYPFHIGLQREVIHHLNPWGLLPNLTTLADELRSAGYATHAVGKWHLGFCKEDYLPLNRGFDQHYGMWAGKEDYYNHTQAQGGHMGYDFRRNMEVDESAKDVYSSILFSQHSSEIIANHDKSKPLFLYLPFQSVHSPLQAPDEYVDMCM